MPKVKRLYKHTIEVWSDKNWFKEGTPLQGGKHDAPLVRLIQEALDDGDAVIDVIRIRSISVGRAPLGVRGRLLLKPEVPDGGG